MMTINRQAMSGIFIIFRVQLTDENVPTETSD